MRTLTISKLLNRLLLRWNKVCRSSGDGMDRKSRGSPVWVPPTQTPIEASLLASVVTFFLKCALGGALLSSRAHVQHVCKQKILPEVE